MHATPLFPSCQRLLSSLGLAMLCPFPHSAPPPLPQVLAAERAALSAVRLEWHASSAGAAQEALAAAGEPRRKRRRGGGGGRAARLRAPLERRVADFVAQCGAEAHRGGSAVCAVAPSISSVQSAARRALLGDRGSHAGRKGGVGVGVGKMGAGEVISGARMELAVQIAAEYCMLHLGSSRYRRKHILVDLEGSENGEVSEHEDGGDDEVSEEVAKKLVSKDGDEEQDQDQKEEQDNEHEHAQDEKKAEIEEEKKEEKDDISDANGERVRSAPGETSPTATAVDKMAATRVAGFNADKPSTIKEGTSTIDEHARAHQAMEGRGGRASSPAELGGPAISDFEAASRLWLPGSCPLRLTPSL